MTYFCKIHKTQTNGKRVLLAFSFCLKNSTFVHCTEVLIPHCDGLPSGPCPKARNDSSFRLGEGEYWCHARTAIKHIIRSFSTLGTEGCRQWQEWQEDRQPYDCCQRTAFLFHLTGIELHLAENVRKLVTCFYTPIEINSAKKVQVVSAFGQLLSDCLRRAERRKSANRIVYEVEVEDILGTWFTWQKITTVSSRFCGR